MPGLALLIPALIVGGSPSPDGGVVAIRVRAECGVAASVVCSGTMVSDRAVLTAAHCVEAAALGSLEVVLAADATTADAPAVRVADGFVVPDVDLGVLVLTEAVAAAPLALGDAPDDATGRSVTIIGYGDDGAGGHGVRLAGTATIDEVDPDEVVLTPGPALTCGGDSGGPVLLAGAVIAVTSYGDPDCARTTTALRLDVQRAFVDDAIAMADTTPTGVPGPGAADCGEPPPDDGGCRAGGGRAGVGAVLVLLALVAACGDRKREGRCHGDDALSWCDDADGKKHGPLREYWAPGQLKLEAMYEHGKQHGRFARWYQDGAKQEEGAMANGLRVGRWTEWYEDGKPKRVSDHDGARVTWTLYREDDGTKWVDGAFRDQREHGHFVEWYPDGTRLAEGEFADGAKVGAWSYWNADGSPSAVELGAYAPAP